MFPAGPGIQAGDFSTLSSRNAVWLMLISPFKEKDNHSVNLSALLVDLCGENQSSTRQEHSMTCQ